MLNININVAPSKCSNLIISAGKMSIKIVPIKIKMFIKKTEIIKTLFLMPCLRET